MDCIPPWLSSNNQCATNITSYHTKQEISAFIWKHFLHEKLNWKPTEAEKRCKQSCKKMTNIVSLRAKQRMPETSVVIRFESLVRIEKKIVVYTWFNFIVDVGSSLGLWLGLSAIGITDMLIEAFVKIKQWIK